MACGGQREMPRKTPKPKKSRRRRVHTGAVVNPLLCAPSPPGDWVDEEQCVCGATYNAYRSGVEFWEGAHRLRQAAKAGGDEGGGFRTEGSVKWVLRVIKLERWYMEHYACGQQAPKAGDMADPVFCWTCGADACVDPSHRDAVDAA